MKRTIFILIVLLLLTASATGQPYRRIIYPPENRKYFINELGSGWATPDFGGISIRSNGELRWYDNGNHVGFEAGALSADQIWVLPTADGASGEVLTTDGAGNIYWSDPNGAGDMTKAKYDVAEDDFADGNDTAYAVSWNGNINAPSMNAVYDKIETVGAGPYDKAKMRRDAAQTINNATPTKILFDAEAFDVGSFAAVADSNFVIAETGQYLVTCGAGLTGCDSGEFMQIEIRVNGTNRTTLRFHSAGANAGLYATCVDVYDLSATDYIEMYIYHNEDGALNTLTSVEGRPRMAVTRLF